MKAISEVNAPTTLFEKVWADHVVVEESTDTPAVLYIDLHIIHEVTTPQAFSMLRDNGLKVRRPDLTLPTLDHSTPTTPVSTFKDLLVAGESAANQVRQMEQNCRDFGLDLLGFGSGAFGALAFGIGTSEVEHVLATQCLLQYKPKTCRVNFEGQLQPGVTAKDMILALIAEIGIGGGTEHVFEYTGEAIRSLSMEERMTICNMSIEGGARAGMIAPDETTFEYLQDRERVPRGADWDEAVARWRTLRSDDGATFDRSVELNAGSLRPMVTFGTNPGMVVGIDEPVPVSGDASFRKALDYMQVESGKPMSANAVDVVFVGSCTNGRISDIEEAARVLEGRKVARGVRMLVVPGSEQVKAEAEARGLDQVILAAGAEWREAGCSMCLGMNGDIAQPGQLCVSTSNRNFEGRQGVGARTVLASPATAAASAIAGHVADPRNYT